jgi:hypothetical protein
MWTAVDEGDVAHLRTLLHRHRLAPVFVDRAGRTPLYRAVVEKARARDIFRHIPFDIFDCCPHRLCLLSLLHHLP